MAGKILLLEGTFQISTRILFEAVNNISLCGMGYSTKLVTGNNSCIVVGNRTDATKACTGISFKDFYIDGSAQTTATVPPESAIGTCGIDIECPNGESKNIFITNVYIYNTGNDAIYGHFAGYTVIDMCVFDHIRGYWGGVHVNTGRGAWIIQKNMFDTCVKYGSRHGTTIGNVYKNCGAVVGSDIYGAICGYPGPIIGNRIEGSVGYAIDTYNVGNNQIISGNRIGSPSNSAIFLNTNGNVVIGNQVTGGYRGVHGATNSTNNLVVGNFISGTSDAAVKMVTNTGHIVKNNQGHATENTGISTITAGQTSVVVNHGLTATPTNIIVTPFGNVGNVWVPSTSITSTQFTINCSSAPASDTTVSWSSNV